MGDVISKALLPQVCWGVDQNMIAFIANEYGGPQAFIFNIIGSTDATVTAQWRDAGGCSRS